ncbi:MAG: putative Inositol 1,4,5-trisphosphate receptor itr-1 [Streblomastix strix]|uniref:Putative Inositol 1,4,5-trisphosphate receptor itr-1 n=1 Tax=Streblomastix strix TaxID=222440 RepID=A0A5J4V2Q4_9EUKA|nr:MAG: putative Inositol 1,4,5-trisphosphate receptor itr-1 [Streblomastix strix]
MTELSYRQSLAYPKLLPLLDFNPPSDQEQSTVDYLANQSLNAQALNAISSSNQTTGSWGTIKRNINKINQKEQSSNAKQDILKNRTELFLSQCPLLDARGIQRWLTHITNVLRTLTEVLQGPCIGNQHCMTETVEGRRALEKLFAMQISLDRIVVSQREMDQLDSNSEVDANNQISNQAEKLIKFTGKQRQNAQKMLKLEKRSNVMDQFIVRIQTKNEKANWNKVSDDYKNLKKLELYGKLEVYSKGIQFNIVKPSEDPTELQKAAFYSNDPYLITYARLLTPHVPIPQYSSTEDTIDNAEAEMSMLSASTSLALACIEGPDGFNNAISLFHKSKLLNLTVYRLNILGTLVLADKFKESNQKQQMTKEAARLYMLYKMLTDAQETRLIPDRPIDGGNEQYNQINSLERLDNQNIIMYQQLSSQSQLKLNQQIQLKVEPLISSIEIVRSGCLQRLYFLVSPLSSYVTQEEKDEAIEQSASSETQVQQQTKFQGFCEELLSSARIRYSFAHTTQAQTENTDVYAQRILRRQLAGDFSDRAEYHSPQDKNKKDENDDPSQNEKKESNFKRIIKTPFRAIRYTFKMTSRLIVNQWTAFATRLLMNLISIVLNVFLLFEDVDSSFATQNWEYTLMEALGILQIVTTTLYFITTFILETHVIAQQSYVRMKRDKRIRLKKNINETDNNKSEQANSSTQQAGGIPLQYRMQYFILSYIQQKKIYSRIAFLIASILGFASHHIFYSILIFDMISQRQEIVSVLKSVSRNLSKLLITGGVFIMILYMFAVIGYVLFSKIFIYDYADPDSVSVCNSLWTCTISLLGQFPSGGEWLLARTLFSEADINNPLYMRILSFIFVMVIWLLIITILFNIVSGIIVDAFFEIRSERETQLENLRNKCFICGLGPDAFFNLENDDDQNLNEISQDKIQIDNINNGEYGKSVVKFKLHCLNAHNPWSYFAYYTQLQENIRIENTLEMNGDETWMMNNFQNSDFSFYPVGRSLDAERAQELQKQNIQLVQSQLKYVSIQTPSKQTGIEKDSLNPIQNNPLSLTPGQYPSLISSNLSETGSEVSISNVVSDMDFEIKQLQNELEELKSRLLYSNKTHNGQLQISVQN